MRSAKLLVEMQTLHPLLMASSTTTTMLLPFALALLYILSSLQLHSHLARCANIWRPCISHCLARSTIQLFTPAIRWRQLFRANFLLNLIKRLLHEKNEAPRPFRPQTNPSQFPLGHRLRAITFASWFVLLRPGITRLQLSFACTCSRRTADRVRSLGCLARCSDVGLLRQRYTCEVERRYRRKRILID